MQGVEVKENICSSEEVRYFDVLYTRGTEFSSLSFFSRKVHLRGRMELKLQIFISVSRSGFIRKNNLVLYEVILFF